MFPCCFPTPSGSSPTSRKLLFPFYVDGQTVGTIWVINHDGGRQFDAEDVRLLGGLADFAAAAYQSYLASTKVRDSERRLRQIIDALPAAIYTTDAEGRVTMFNEAAATFAGRTPQLGTDSWCVTWRLFWPDGTPMPHDQCPMATAVKERRPIRGIEGIVERPDGTRRRFIPYPTPLFDSSGTMVGAVNMAVDITDRKLAEEAIARHRDEQAALYAFTDRLFRAASLQEIYDAALKAICQVLGCERASILLFDDAGVMRFVAWIGLSEQYRRAIEGHSPWTRKVRDPQPICIADVDASDLAGSLKATVKAEGITATAFFPLLIDGELVGKFMAYYAAPHTFDQIEINLAVTIARQLGFSLERRRAEEALRETQRQLVSELAATRQLQKISTQLIHASDAQVLYEKILDAAMAIMGSDFASMQTFYPERGELRLLAYRGFNPTAAAFWEWVRPGSGSTCGAALATGHRSIVPDIELSDFMAGSEDLETYRQTDIRAVQSTPLLSRAGRLLGMISTHWRNPHQPSERDLRLLDVVARQAADLIERKRAEEQQLALNAELNHRVKNVLATVSSIINQTRKGSGTYGEFVVGLDRRIRSLANTHDLLSRAHWHGVALAEIVQREFGPYGRGNSDVGGPSVTLKAEAAQAVAMVLHELTTNAAKYGAFSKRNGRVLLKWWWQQNGGDPRLVIEWKEVGGPAVVPPSRSGYGTSVVRELIPFELGGTVDLVFAADGLECRLELSADWVSTASSSKDASQELHAASADPNN
jgi:PAS domain S-box-containing protein